MANWMCKQCEVEMEEVNNIGITYKEIELPPPPGLRCPSCRKEYIEVDVVINELNPAEEMLEGK